ncbi:hypothetical protein GCM10010168_62200 [Actinoplanes ianthinogenes]|uniref:Uncharacterized protein n=1 Tax=Actinoplanes ianthinogenes TaxID=122358 RepID=A0ABM7LJV3_9ACTN|nr:hypothetical protein Aiant_01890 [Actinoplanes ianthinogenes]GGR35456.1 hypothetical protein GCM10010168_62200 [Actinoplanes ianthinogenes]
MAGAAGLFGTDQVWQRIAFVPPGLIVGAVYGYLAVPAADRGLAAALTCRLAQRQRAAGGGE